MQKVMDGVSQHLTQKSTQSLKQALKANNAYYVRSLYNVLIQIVKLERKMETQQS